MTTEKESIFEYADETFLVWLEDHIRYFQTIVSNLEGILSVYHEMKAEQDGGFGWVPTRELIELVNEAKERLEALVFASLEHQKIVIASELALKKMGIGLTSREKGEIEASKKTEEKKLDPAIQ